MSPVTRHALLAGNLTEPAKRDAEIPTTRYFRARDAGPISRIFDRGLRLIRHQIGQSNNHL
jgi:hypothetical protein